MSGRSAIVDASAIVALVFDEPEADALADADAFAIDLYRIPPRAALVAALETGLAAYDAAYWLVARALSAELVTLDRALARAART